VSSAFRRRTASIVFDHGGFILTNQRVIHVVRSRLGGTTSVQTITLEKLDSVQVDAERRLVLLALAAVLALIGQKVQDGAGYHVAAAACVAAFFLTRRKVIRLRSGNSEIVLNVRALAHEKIQELVFAVEEAKQERMEGLQHPSSTGTRKAVSERLSALDDLRDQGLLDSQEYQRKRDQILDDL